MKKIMLTLSVCFLITGCSSSNSKNIVLENDQGMAALVSEEGELVSDFKYTDLYDLNSTYLGVGPENIELIGNEGEIVRQFDSGEVKIGGELFAISYEDEDGAGVTAVYNNEGDLLYDSSDSLRLLIDDVFVVVENDESTILGPDGEVFYHLENVVDNVSLNNSTLLIDTNDGTLMLDYNQTPNENNVTEVNLLGNFEIIGYDTTVGYALYDFDNRRLAVVDTNFELENELVCSFDSAYFDYNHNLILVESTENFIVDLENSAVVELNSFYYNYNTYVLKDTTRVYGPHIFFDENIQVPVEDIQLAPNGTLTINGLIPVYVRDYGFTYYNYEGVQAIDDFYDEVGLFSEDDVAIVKIDARYGLIDSSGTVLVADKESISSIAAGYYAIYDDNMTYAVANENGTQLIDGEFMGSGEIYRYSGGTYGVFVRAGMSYVYDMSGPTELFHYEGELKFESGYFYKGIDAIFDLEGNQIYQRGE